MFTGGCNGVLSNNSTTAPNACGGTASITFTVTSDCETNRTCTATFTVDPAPVVMLTCPTNATEAACQTQAQIDTKFNTWLDVYKRQAMFTGGCNATISNNNNGAPMACGGSKTVTFTVTSTCEPNKTCMATFTVTAAPAVVLTCPVNATEAACQTQAEIDTKFTTWLGTAMFTGGCNGVLTNDNTGAPMACGGTKTVIFTVNSDCEGPKTCSATFTVTAAPAVMLTCPTNATEAACQTQAEIDTKFTTWLGTAMFTGGCNGVLSNDNTGAPMACGGTKTVVFTVTSSCESNNTCTATFTVTPAPVVMLTCPANQTEAACQSQADINTKFNTWLGTASFSGGCNATLSNNNSGAPDKCGGVANVTFTVTSTCEPNNTCTASFTVTPAPAVVLTCPTNQMCIRDRLDTTKPTFDIPNDTTLYKGGVSADTNIIVNYNFNRGNSYPKLYPRLYFGILSEVDSSSNVFLTDTGTITGPLAFAVDSFVGKAMRVDTSDRPGHWQFNLSGFYLSLIHI